MAGAVSAATAGRLCGTANAVRPCVELCCRCCWRGGGAGWVWALARASPQPGPGAGHRWLAAHGLVIEANLGDAALLQLTAARPVHHFEGIKTDPAHKRDLIREHVAHGAQLAAEA